MIPLKRIPLLVGLIVSFTATGFAQKFCTVAPPSPFHHSGQIVTSLDEAAGRMKTTLEHPQTVGNGIYLAASFFYQDRRLRTPPTISIFFISASKHPKFTDSHNLSIAADDAELAHGMRTNYFTEKGEKGLTIEKTVITLSYEQLVSLTKSNRVTAQLGDTQIVLTNNHLEALREIASLMVPPPRGAKR
ncbi:MAG TPA: hypothetical protein VF779_12100 [Pyrinomonadaceae bacterium]